MVQAKGKLTTLISPARQAAYRILLRAQSGRDYAVDLLQGPALEPLSDADRRLATELVMGVLRWRGDLDFQIEKLSGRALSYFDPEIAEVLRLAVYQIRFLSAIPKAAAVNQAVEMAKLARKKSASGLVNAVLRKCDRAAFNGLAPEDLGASREYVDSAQRSTPAWLYERWERRFGQKKARMVMLGCQAIPRACLRVRGGAPERENIRLVLAQAGVAAHPGVYSRRALVVDSGSVLSTQAWREGQFALQGEASQLAAELVKPQVGERVLDLCAAPGVKTGQLTEMLREGVVVACDRSMQRMRTMNESILRAWPEGVRLHRVLLDARQPLPFAAHFDRVLVDAPCSGTGTLARNPEIKWRLKPRDLPRLAEMQCEILGCALETLGYSSRLVYATCSLEPEENEEVVAKVVAGRPGFRLLSAAELQCEFPEMGQLFEAPGYFRTYPGVHLMDGFFATVIVRC
ncbi:MAG TPA: 16S rRNA (cytosine(967)-C(5))-methyltransferase RsmB [Terriglobia bacterium]|nr:16S rRNA (cytosine(967)-C(5))-methyltransferase RsmB [Terriglobia bacterium]